MWIGWMKGILDRESFGVTLNPLYGSTELTMTLPAVQIT